MQAESLLIRPESSLSNIPDINLQMGSVRQLRPSKTKQNKPRELLKDCIWDLIYILPLYSFGHARLAINIMNATKIKMEKLL